MLCHFLPPGREFQLTPARFFEHGPFPFQFLLGRLSSASFLLHFPDLGVNLLPRRRALRTVRLAGRSGAAGALRAV